MRKWKRAVLKNYLYANGQGMKMFRAVWKERFGKKISRKSIAERIVTKSNQNFFQRLINRSRRKGGATA